MSPVRKTTGVLAGFAIAASLVLTGCGTGRNAETSRNYDAAVGSNDRGGEVEVHNALFVANDNQTATLSTRLLNTTDEVNKLTGVTVTGEQNQPLKVTLNGPLTLTPGQLAEVGDDGEVFLDASDVVPGYFVTITFEFADSASIAMDVPVVERTDIYSTVADGTAADQLADATKKLAEETAKQGDALAEQQDATATE